MCQPNENSWISNISISHIFNCYSNEHMHESFLRNISQFVSNPLQSKMRWTNKDNTWEKGRFVECVGSFKYKLIAVYEKIINYVFQMRKKWFHQSWFIRNFKLIFKINFFIFNRFDWVQWDLFNFSVYMFIKTSLFVLWQHCGIKNSKTSTVLTFAA